MSSPSSRSNQFELESLEPRLLLSGDGLLGIYATETLDDSEGFQDAIMVEIMIAIIYYVTEILKYVLWASSDASTINRDYKDRTLMIAIYTQELYDVGTNTHNPLLS